MATFTETKNGDGIPGWTCDGCGCFTTSRLFAERHSCRSAGSELGTTTPDSEADLILDATEKAIALGLERYKLHSQVECIGDMLDLVRDRHRKLEERRRAGARSSMDQGRVDGATSELRELEVLLKKARSIGEEALANAEGQG